MRRSVRAQVAVVVRAARRQQAERSRGHPDRSGRRGVEAPIVHFEPAKPDLDEFAQERQPGWCLAEVGKDREASGRDDGPDRVVGPQAVAPDIARGAVADQACEGVLDARRVAGRDQRAGDRRTAERIVTVERDRGHLPVDPEIQLAQALDGPCEAHPSLLALNGERRLEGLVGRIHADAQDVQLALPEAEVPGHQGIDLDPWQQGHPDGDRVVGEHLAITGQRVVIGQGEGGHTARSGRGEQVAGLKDAVGPPRMGMQVDRGRTGRDDLVGQRRRIVTTPGSSRQARRPRRERSPRVHLRAR